MYLPYLGLTGLDTPQDAAELRQALHDTPAPPTHLVMAAVLVSDRTLRREPVSSRRYPSLVAARSILTELAGDPWLLPSVHYNGRRPEPLDDEIRRLLEALPETRLLQLNLRRPDPEALARIRAEHPTLRLVLQVNRSSLDEPTPAAALGYISRYAGVATDALLDLSGGRGTPLDTLWMQGVLGAFHPLRRAGIVPGVAGGLGPGRTAPLADLRALAPLSVDAETALRTPLPDPIPGESGQDRWSHPLAARWLAEAGAALAPRPPARPTTR